MLKRALTYYEGRRDNSTLTVIKNVLKGKKSFHYLHEKIIFEGSEQWVRKKRLLYRFDLGGRRRKRGNETGAEQEMTVTPTQSCGTCECEG